MMSYITARVVTCLFESRSPFSWSKFVTSVRPDDVPHQQWENEQFREKITQFDGRAYIDSLRFKIAFAEAASMLGTKIPGKGAREYGKHFKASIIPLTEPGIDCGTVDQIPYEDLLVDAQGKRGGSRVLRRFPYVKSWTGQVEFALLTEVIPEDVFQSMVEFAGMNVGIGRWRPINGGMYGRFVCTKFTWIRGAAALERVQKA